MGKVLTSNKNHLFVKPLIRMTCWNPKPGHLPSLQLQPPSIFWHQLSAQLVRQKIGTQTPSAFCDNTRDAFGAAGRNFEPPHSTNSRVLLISINPSLLLKEMSGN